MRLWHRMVVLGLSGAALVGVIGGINIAEATPGAPSTSGPTVFEQQTGTSSSLFALFPAMTTISTSPVLPTGTYVVQGVVTVGHVLPGFGATCGITTSSSTDVVAADTGQLGNGNTAGSFIDGNCVITGTVKIKAASDQITLWAAASNGTGATLDNASINETPVGKSIIN